MAMRRGRTRRTRYRAGRTGIGPSSTTAEPTLLDLCVKQSGATFEDMSDLAVGQGRRLECGCCVERGADGFEIVAPPGEQAISLVVQRLPGGCAVLRAPDGQVVLTQRPDGEWVKPGGGGESMFGRECCEEYDRVAPDAARRFKEQMSFGPDWRPVPRPADRPFDRAAADEAFVDMTAHRVPGETREQRLAEVAARRDALSEARPLVGLGCSPLASAE